MVLWELPCLDKLQVKVYLEWSQMRTHIIEAALYQFFCLLSSLSVFSIWLRHSRVSWHFISTDHTYIYPKTASECERQKEKYTKNIERDQDRNREITKEGGKIGQRSEGEKEREWERK